MNILIVGASGSMGKRHSENIQALGHKIFTVDPINADYASLHNALADNNEYDAAIVSSPTNLHFDHAKQILESGIPCAVEKPLARTRQEARTLCSLADKQNIPNMVLQSFRWHPCIKWLMQDQHILDTVLHVNIFGGQDLESWYPNRNYHDVYAFRKDMGGGAVLTSGSHMIDIIRYLFGEPTDFHGLCRNTKTYDIDVDDVCHILGKTDKNITFTGSTDFLNLTKTSILNLVCNKTSLTINLVTDTIEIETDTQKSTVNLKFDGNSHYLEEVESFLHSIIFGIPLACPMSEGLANLEWMERIRTLH